MATDIDKHQKRVKQGLSQAFDDPGTTDTTFDINEDRLIIFSDHHRGAKDGADDFWRCERAYHAALGHYFEAGHTLLLLGDVEELWENKPDEVMGKTDEPSSWSRSSTATDASSGSGATTTTNWRHEKDTEKHLHPLYPRLAVHEAMRMRIVEDGKPIGMLFLVHGHQGDARQRSLRGALPACRAERLATFPATLQDSLDDPLA